MTTTENEEKSGWKAIPLVTCEYCGNQVPISEVYNATIGRNGDIHFLKFCCKDCASKYQMGAEG
jgi:hypothetical protein